MSYTGSIPLIRLLPPSVASFLDRDKPSIRIMCFNGKTMEGSSELVFAHKMFLELSSSFPDILFTSDFDKNVEVTELFNKFSTGTFFFTEMIQQQTAFKSP